MTKTEILEFLSVHKEAYARKYGVTKIGLFGSVARGEASRESDIDIFAEMPPKFDLLVRLQEELEAGFQRRVDLVRLREKMNSRLKENILRDGLYV
jgi:predicted nucleotidyltransferase